MAAIVSSLRKASVMTGGLILNPPAPAQPTVGRSGIVGAEAAGRLGDVVCMTGATCEKCGLVGFQSAIWPAV